MRYILLVEDNEALQRNNKEFLEESGGYSVRLAMNLAQARNIIAMDAPDLIVLDIMLPDGNGLDFLRELRQRDADIPVLLLTALSESSDEVRGIREGGDDYIAKPFDRDVLLARIDKLLSKKKEVEKRLCEAVKQAKSDIVKYGVLRVNYATHRVLLNGEDINLRQKEFLLLTYFLKNIGKKITAEELYEAVWGQDAAGSVGAVTVCIHDLRKKLKTEDEIAIIIETVERKYYVCKVCPPGLHSV